jgi:bacterioferritin
MLTGGYMKGNEKLLAILNELLAEELTAISQYMVHSEMCDNWGYEKLHKSIEKQAIDEMKHAEWLIGRILYLEGTPVVSKLNQMKIGANVPAMLANDGAGEQSAVQMYNKSIIQARELVDNGTADLLTKILLMEEGHSDWLEQQQDQIKQMGLENYLANQSGKTE